MSDDLLAFLAAVHDADEQAARAAGGQQWPDPCLHGNGPFPASHDLCARLDGPDITIYDEGGHTPEQARHIARHDPKSVLARVEAERALVAMHWSPGTFNQSRHEKIAFCATCGSGDEEYPTAWPCPTLRALAWGYRHREGYRADLWAPDGVEVGA